MKYKSWLTILFLTLLIFNPSHVRAENHTYTYEETQMTVFNRDDLSEIHNEVVIEEKEVERYEPYKAVPTKVRKNSFIQYEYDDKNIVEYNFSNLGESDFKTDHKLSNAVYSYLEDNFLYSDERYHFELPTADGYIGVRDFQKESIYNLSISYDRFDILDSSIENHYVNVTELMNLEDTPEIDPETGWKFRHQFNNEERRYINDGWLAYYFTFVNDTEGYIRYANGTVLGYHDNYENWIILHNLYNQSTQYHRFPLRTLSSDLPTNQTFPLPNEIILTQDLNTIVGFHADNFNRIYVYDGDIVETIDLPKEIDSDRKHFEDFSRNELLLDVKGEVFVFNIENKKFRQIDIGETYRSAFTDDHIVVLHREDPFRFISSIDGSIWLGILVLVPISYFLYRKYRMRGI